MELLKGTSVRINPLLHLSGLNCYNFLFIIRRSIMCCTFWMVRIYLKINGSDKRIK